MQIQMRHYVDGCTIGDVDTNFSHDDIWIQQEIFGDLRKNILAYKLSKIEFQNSQNSRWRFGVTYDLKFNKEKYIRVCFKKLMQLHRNKKNTTRLATTIKANLKVLGFSDVEIYTVINPNSVTEDRRLEKHFGIMHLVGNAQKLYKSIN